MTVSTDVRVVSRDGDGVRRSFSFSPMVIYASTELEVKSRDSTTGVETTWTLGTGATNFSVDLTTFPGTGSITLPAAGGTLLSATEKVFMRRVPLMKQQTDLENRGGYIPSVQETQFDKLFMIDLRLLEELDRCPKMPLTEPSTFDPSLPTAVASRYLRINAAGTGFEWVDVTSVTGALSSSTPAKTVMTGPTAGVSADIARADHTHQVADIVRVGANIYNSQNFT